MITSIRNYLDETIEICKKIDNHSIAELMNLIANVKNQKGRIFLAGVGGSSANASHAVNDFRKILGIETHSLTENVSELTARINDDCWENSLVETIKIFNPNQKDAVFILSVGGGTDTTSNNLTALMKYASSQGIKIMSIVSRDGGYAKKLSDACVLIPVINESKITPHAEEMQAVIWHLIVSILGEK